MIDGKYNNLKNLLLRHEGLRFFPYLDTVGKTTIGIGRNLTDVGISELEAMGMLTADIERAVKDCVDKFPWFQSISVVRQDVVTSMVFNLGIEKFQEFKGTIGAIVNGNYGLAADRMLESLWARQVGHRAQELSSMMRLDKYPP